jgi:hypothetical protein
LEAAAEAVGPVAVEVAAVAGPPEAAVDSSPAEAVAGPEVAAAADTEAVD